MDVFAARSPAAPPGDSGEIERRILAIQRPHPNLFWLYLIQSCAALVFAPVIFVPLYFKYHTLRYRIDGEGVSASWGILFRREIHLTFKRIQDIHVKRNLIERLLGIGTVEVQTASGSSSAELSLEGMDDYDAVRDFLYGKMRGHERPGGRMAAGAGGTAGAGAAASGGAAGGAEAMADVEPAAIAAAEAEALALLRGIAAELGAARVALEKRS